MSREMKHSGIPWIGEIPKDWNVNLLSLLFYEHKQKNVDLTETNLLSLSYGKIVRKDINTKEGLLPESFDGYNIISNGDIVFRLTDLQNDKRSLRTGLCKEKGIITSAYVTIRGKQSLNSTYYHYLFHSYDLCKVFYGMGDGVRQGMNFGDLRKLLILLPQLSEQQKIASYLDRKCSEIDEMVVLQEKIIEELKAYKQSVITEAVTKGLNPDVPMKDSGIEWIGEIPENWEVKRLKNCTELNPSFDFKIKSDTLVSYMPMECLRNGVIQERISPYKEVSNYTPFQNEDIVMAKVTPCFENGNIAIARNLCEGYGFGTSEIFVIRCQNGICNQYVFYYLQSAYIKNLGVSSMTGTGGLKRVNPTILNNAVLLHPSLPEQQTIASYLDEKCLEIDSLISIKQSKIESLKEYKKSIIYEYVTGKKEVI